MACSFLFPLESRKMPMTQCIPRLAAILLGLAGSRAIAAPPAHYPEFSRESAAPMVVVATVKPGKELPQFDDCGKPTVVCIDPPPFWFKASIQSVVYGKRLPRSLNVATTNHFGMAEYELFKSASFLLLVLSDGKEFVMPRYAMEGVFKDKRRHFHMPVYQPAPIFWLPCSVTSLRERISQDDFDEDLAIPQDSYQVRNNPELFQITAKGAVPLYGVSLARLAVHLDSLAPTAAQMWCETPKAEGSDVE